MLIVASCTIVTVRVITMVVPDDQNTNNLTIKDDGGNRCGGSGISSKHDGETSNRKYGELEPNYGKLMTCGDKLAKNDGELAPNDGTLSDAKGKLQPEREQMNSKDYLLKHTDAF